MSLLHPQEPDRVELAELPTPVRKLPRLAAHLGVPRLLMKRDDLSGVELSGNKVRKLEYLLSEAISQGADTLVTHGGTQSNHCRATAACGARLGLRVRLLLRGDKPAGEADGNLFLDQLFGAQCSYHSPEEYTSSLDQLVDAAVAELADEGRVPYFFAVGASVPLGCWGYIRCIAELVEQLGADTPVDIYCATSSGGTQVGLMIGKALLSCENWSVRGVPVSDSVEYFRENLRNLERATDERFDLQLSVEQTPIELVEGFIGPGYAVPYPEALATTRLVAETEGILLDPSYTAKAMTGMLADLAHRPAGRVPVFLHTGGCFGLMARRDLFPSPE